MATEVDVTDRSGTISNNNNDVIAAASESADEFDSKVIIRQRSKELLEAQKGPDE